MYRQIQAQETLQYLVRAEDNRSESWIRKVSCSISQSYLDLGWS